MSPTDAHAVTTRCARAGQAQTLGSRRTGPRRFAAEAANRIAQSADRMSTDPAAPDARIVHDLRATAQHLLALAAALETNQNDKES